MRNPLTTNKKAPQLQLGGETQTRLRLPPPGSLGKPKTARNPLVSELDVREQMFNRGETGPIHEISLSRERVTESRGLMIDVDPSLLRDSSLLGHVPRKPRRLYHETIAPLLSRHDTLACAEVRQSGRGLHLLFWFEEPEPCDSDDARERIESTFELISNVLPGDPQQPLLNAMTRALGSTNSKNGSAVAQLAPGRRITFADLEQLATEISAAPFQFVLQVWSGTEGVCPLCRRDRPHSVKKTFATCYQCGRLGIDAVIESAFHAKTAARSGVSHGE